MSTNDDASRQDRDSHRQGPEAAHAFDHGHGHGHAHDHGRGNGHSHAHALGAPAGDFSRAFAIGIVLNLVFVAVEAFYGWQVNSLALLADAAHNLSDVAGLGVAWAGALAGNLRPDARHTYGWKRASILAAFANAVLLLVAMGSLAWEAIGRLGASQPPVAAIPVMVVAGIGIVINLGTALLFLRGRHGDMNVRGAFLHMAGDALVSAGVVVAGALAYAFAWHWIDPVASLAIAVVIVLATWSLFRQSLHLLFDGVPEGIELGEVRRTLEALPGVERVHDLHVWATGTTETALTAHLVMPRGHPDDPFFETASAHLARKFRISHVTLQVVRRPSMASCDEPAPCGDARRRGRLNEPSATQANPFGRSMKFKDYYETLGVARGATQDEIKKAYRKLARKYHPDVSKLPDTETRFKEVNEANEVLGDPEKRAAYDQMGSQYQAGQDFQPPPDWDAGFEFRGARRRRRSRPGLRHQRLLRGAVRPARPVRRAGRRPARTRQAAARTTTPRS